VRVNPFDLLFGRLTLEGEVAIIGPLAIEVAPSWIWGSPTTELLDEKGFAIAGNIAFYLQGKRLQGFWIKAHVGWETFEATRTHSFLPECTQAQRALKDVMCAMAGTARVSSAILGGMIGTSTVFGKNGGFILSGGIGIAGATAPPVAVVALSKDEKTPTDPDPIPSEIQVYYEGTGKIKLLGALSLGIAF
jgi:hypothetical protein